MCEQRDLCERLLHADSGEDVVRLLEERGYWDDPSLWRYYGDVENNWGQSGNQQSLAEAALAEKIINSVDARLINECLMRDIDPSGPDAPQTMRSAVAHFFDNSPVEKTATGGFVEDWSVEKTREIAEGITLTATGVRPKGLNITISDCGEGQSPGRLPDTILSLGKSNKQKIRFVQGQFNQGGTGALRFCGNRNLQLVISRRNPGLLDQNASKRDREWSFTIVRREFPSDRPGESTNSVYTYLAPVGIRESADSRHGDVLSFAADTFPIFPSEEQPYGRESRFGTAVKMYEYSYLGETSNVLRGNSLLRRLDLLLPAIALPIRIYEHREDRTGKHFDVGDRSRNISGLLRRLKDNLNVENQFPVLVPFQIEGEKLQANIFAFNRIGSTARSDGEEEETPKGKKVGTARRYRKREGIVFVLNGQVQGSLAKDFFRRDKVKMKPLADDILVFVECDQLKNITREDLFMASRDRLTESKFKREIVASLERIVSSCEELKLLRNRRQQERMRHHVEDDQPLTDVLRSLIKTSPNLRMLLVDGQRIPSPFKTLPADSGRDEVFVGEFYPTFFNNKGVTYGETQRRTCAVNHRMRLVFETDAQNDYFIRIGDAGGFELTWKDGSGRSGTTSPVGPNLKNGIATVTVDLPAEVGVGDEIEFIARTVDPVRSFESRISVSVAPKVKSVGRGGGERNPPSPNDGTKRERPKGLEPPKVREIRSHEWEAEGFDKSTAMRMESLGYSNEDETEMLGFLVNMDNIFLENEAKQRRLSEDQIGVLSKQFKYANVLIGLSMVHGDKEDSRNTKNRGTDGDAHVESLDDRVERTCRAMAPFIPALMSLGSSDLDAEDTGDGMEESG